MSEHPNPPAFPMHPATFIEGGQGKHELWQGMTLRDWFAGQALAGISQEYLRRNGFHGHDQFAANIAVHAYRIADALLATRKGETE